MHILFINQLIGTEIIKAICWALVHSLWQGLLLAIAGGFVVMFTKKRHPSLRYNLLSTLFLLFVIASAYTFITQLTGSTLKQTTLPVNDPVSLVSAGNATPPVNNNFLRSIAGNLSNTFTYYFDKHAPLIVVAWFIILSARLIKMISGLSYINRLRNQQVQEPIPYWKGRLRELQSMLQIHKPVALLESGLIKVPMAVGWLKPLILVPAGLFTHLSGEQLEAILLHELAHIRRRDYFVNLVQSFAETIFFFNPAVLWISALIREERENCCDDMAIAITKNKTKFINALVSFQEFNTNEYAMLFPGRKNQLLNRVKRILFNTNNTLNSIEKTGMLSCCLAIVLLSAFVIPTHDRQRLLDKMLDVDNTSQTKSSTAFEQTIKPRARLVAHGNPHTKENIRMQSEKIIKVREMLLHHDDSKESKIDQQREPTTNRRIDTIPARLPEINIKLNAATNLTFTNSLHFSAAISLNSPVVLSKLDVKLAPINIKISPYTNKIEYKSHSIDSTYFTQPGGDDSARQATPNKPYPKAKPEPGLKVEPNAADATKARPEPHSNPLADPVIIDLIKLNVVAQVVLENKQNFSYLLNSDELIVQGVRQAEAVYQKFRLKYLSATGKTTRAYIWRN